MKKLIIACSALFVLGLGLLASGHALGGQLYSVYYNGALHPFSDAARSVSDQIAKAEEHIDDHYNADWAEEYIDMRRQAIERYELPKQSLDHISDIDLTLKGGDFSISFGNDFALTGDAAVVESKFKNGEWSAELWANDDEVGIILPESVQRWHDIEISCKQSANVSISDALHADNIELSTENGTMNTQELSAQTIELVTNNGILCAVLPETADRYHVQARTNGGPVSLNGAVLVQLDEAGNGTAQFDNSYDPETNSYRVDRPYTAEFTVSGSGRINILTQTTLSDTAVRDVT